MTPGTFDPRDRLLLSFDGRSIAPAAAEAIAARAAGVTLYRHLNIGSPAEVRALTDELQAAAARLGRPPLLVAADHETGQLHAMGEAATPFAGAMALGATGDADLAERVGAAIGAELRAMGVTVVYAPDCDLATNPRNPVVGIRSFGDGPAAVGRLAAAMVRGLQSAGVAATVKHLPGHGEPGADTHHEMPVIERSRAELLDRELVPFRAGIEAGALLAMAGHLAVPSLTGRRDLPATLSSAILRDLLRTELRFGGVTVSDALDMGAITADGTGVDVAAALRAGTDLLLCGPDPAAQARVEAGLAEAALSDPLDPDEIAATDARLIGLRRWLAGFVPPPLAVVGSTAHRALAAELAARSITLIRDRDGLLPIVPRDGLRILVIEPEPRDLTPADTTSWLPSGGLAAAVRERLPGVAGVLVGAVIEPAEIAALVGRAAAADLVVLGTVDALGEPTVGALARALGRAGRPVIGVALRGPWDASAYPGVGTVVATYGIQPPTLRAFASALVGVAQFTGRAPVRLPD